MTVSILGFDFGTQSIGVAIGNPITGSASALKALKARDGIPNWDELGNIIQQWQPQRLVVGLPLNMDGSEQAITTRARKFANRLHGRYGLPVDLQDERLTTVDARATLFEKGGYRALGKGAVDSASAVVIVESWYAQGTD
ncbi:Holliday junction resolvase RuvX [Celerinatantimonas diazotrophica]|uniref:Putative pre-16S rRNA nuclease n=1 Tax=Celerinatantimonas diazotrophica TaxID=412034 RepID=A0A4R1J9A3_9GAMM|nr:Holliday junction resolvase RuvX [Celerinatantimonas diazotrophica]TCK46987.1 putative Holliday junction resolvase [Celerinatantimonas diazotrophica]CAG9295755.1 Putative pre-16S rRNA nuclease [Celerinatantimonas diazotrophica]